jgi:hypothetical protein
METPRARAPGEAPRVDRTPSALDDLHRPVIVAVVAVMMVQAPVVEEVAMIPVRDDGMVATFRGLAIVGVAFVLRAPVVRRAAVGILLADLDAMGFGAVSPLMLEAISGQVVHVVTMANGHVPACRAMSMRHSLLLSGYPGLHNEGVSRVVTSVDLD